MMVFVFQVNLLLQDYRDTLYLGNGLVAQIDSIGVLSLDLSGSLDVSLWSKYAESLIRNRWVAVRSSSWCHQSSNTISIMMRIQALSHLLSCTLYPSSFLSSPLLIFSLPLSSFCPSLPPFPLPSFSLCPFLLLSPISSSMCPYLYPSLSVFLPPLSFKPWYNMP